MKQLQNVESLALGGNLVSLLDKVGNGEHFTIMIYGFSSTQNKKLEEIPTLVLGIEIGKEKHLVITRSAGLLDQFKRLEHAGELEKQEKMSGHLRQQKFEKDGDSRTTWKFVVDLPEDLF